MTKNENVIEGEGKVTECLRRAMFTVEPENGHQVRAHISGKTRKNHIKIMLEDRVLVALRRTDLTAAGSCTGPGTGTSGGRHLPQ